MAPPSCSSRSVLRSLVAGVGAISLLCGLTMLSAGNIGGGIGLSIWGGLLLAGILFERVRYKPFLRTPPGPGWERTTERFVDEKSGKTVNVYIRPDSGERIYVEEP